MKKREPHPLSPNWGAIIASTHCWEKLNSQLDEQASKASISELIHPKRCRIREYVHSQVLRQLGKLYE